MSRKCIVSSLVHCPVYSRHQVPGLDICRFRRRCEGEEDTEKKGTAETAETAHAAAANRRHWRSVSVFSVQRLHLQASWKMMKTHHSFILSFLHFSCQAQSFSIFAAPGVLPSRLSCSPTGSWPRGKKKSRWISMNFRRDVNRFEKSWKKSQSAEPNTVVWTYKNLDYVIMYSCIICGFTVSM